MAQYSGAFRPPSQAFGTLVHAHTPSGILNTTTMDKFPAQRRGTTSSAVFKSLLGAVLVAIVVSTSLGLSLGHNPLVGTKVPINAAQIVQQCQALHVLPGPPKNFHHRTESDRYVAGTPPTLVRNATIWTGRVSGYEVITGDLLIDKGIIQGVGKLRKGALEAYKDLVVIDAAGAWVTPGYVLLNIIVYCGQCHSAPLQRLSALCPLIFFQVLIFILSVLLTCIRIWEWIAPQNFTAQTTPTSSKVSLCPGFAVSMASTPTTRHTSSQYPVGLPRRIFFQDPRTRSEDRRSQSNYAPLRSGPRLRWFWSPRILLTEPMLICLSPHGGGK